jgi:ABC-type uncharacterized transport system substrate-binding protein
MPTVGILHSGTSGKHDAQIAALTHKIDKKSVTILSPLYGHDDPGAIEKHADDLVNKQKVDVLVAAGGTRCAEEAKKQTVGKTVAVIFTSADDSFDPGPNMTGIYAHTSKLDPVRLGLLHELLPAEKKVGVLAASRPKPSSLADVATRLGLALEVTDVTGGDKTTFSKAFRDWQQKGIKAAVVAANPFFNDHRHDIVDVATIAAIYQWHEFVELGGLMSYGPKLTEAYELAGVLVNGVLGGAAVKHLPAVSLTKFELYINLKTARGLGIAIPDTLLARADRLIA